MMVVPAAFAQAPLPPELLSSSNSQLPQASGTASLLFLLPDCAGSSSHELLSPWSPDFPTAARNVCIMQLKHNLSYQRKWRINSQFTFSSTTTFIHFFPGLMVTAGVLSADILHLEYGSVFLWSCFAVTVWGTTFDYLSSFPSSLLCFLFLTLLITTWDPSPQAFQNM